MYTGKFHTILMITTHCLGGCGDVAQLVEHQTGMPLTQVRFPDAARVFSARVNFQCRLSYGVHTPLCAVTCINTCAHLKDPGVHVRVWWIIETLKHPACIIGWVARLSQLAFPEEKPPKFPMGEIPLGQYSCKEKKEKKST